MNAKRFFLLAASLLLASATAQAQTATDSARPQPGYLGAIFPDKTTAADHGLKIIDLVPGGPAEKAGLKIDDVITAIDGHAIHSPSDLGAMLKPLGPGSKPTFEVERAGAKEQMAVTLGERPAPTSTPPQGENQAPPSGTLPPPNAGARGDNLPPPPNADAPNFNPPANGEPRGASNGSQRAILGVRTQPLTEETRRRLGLTTTAGAWITSRTPDSPAARAGLPLDCAIVAVDGRTINSPNDLAAAVAAAGVGKAIDIGFVQNGRTSHVKATLASAASVGPPTGASIGPDAAMQRPLLSQIPRILGQVGSASEDHARVQELEQRVQQLERRLDALEGRAAPRAPAPGANLPTPPPPNALP